MVTPGPAAPRGAGTVGPWGTTRPGPPPERRRSLLATVLALAIIAAGIVAAIVLFTAASRRYDDNVAGFARAPVGCDTTLGFDRAGEYVLYLETTGHIDELDGSCDLADSYDRASVGLPRPTLVLRAADADDADDVDLAPTAGVDYDTGDFVGTAYRLADVPAAGDYVLTVDDDSDPEPYAIAVGLDPAAGVAALRWAALGALLAGLVIGGAVFAIGARRRQPPPPAPDDTWSPWAPAPTGPFGDPGARAWPQSPPVHPPPAPAVPDLPPGAPRPTVPPWAAPPRQPQDPFDQ